MAIRLMDYRQQFKNPEIKMDLHWWDYNKTIIHTHNYYEFFIVTKGKINHRINGKDFTVTKRGLCFIKPSDVHGFSPAENTETQHLNVSATPEYFSRLCGTLDSNIQHKIENYSEPICTTLSEKEYDFLINLAKQINFTPSQQNDTRKCLLKTLFINILSIVNIQCLKEIIYPQWFSEVINRINTVEMIGCKVTDIYELAPYSPPMLISFFKKYVGDNIITYLTKVKINYACNLLEHTNFSTLHISSTLAYDSLSHFNRVFKKLTGLTPSEYRNQKRR